MNACIEARSLPTQDKAVESESCSSEQLRPRGLINGSTLCYLNSLLQALFHTTEFRRYLLFTYRFTGPPSHQSRSITRQLQLLFARLLVSRRPALSTKDLVLSFGWSAQQHVQHDVQELNRLLLEAIEKSLALASSSHVVQSPSAIEADSSSDASRQCFTHHLYSGKLFDRLQCMRCNHAKVRIDSFCDLSLEINGIHSLSEALDRFVAVEKLEGENQWLCEKCGQKVNATKSLSFASLPPILSLHLKRFTISDDTRKKLMHTVTFDSLIDLQPWLAADIDQEKESCYELFAVLCHYGSSASSGHYRALIRKTAVPSDVKLPMPSQTSCHDPLSTDSMWMDLNDEHASEAATDALIAAHGGEVNKNSCTAYMLFYTRKTSALQPSCYDSSLPLRHPNHPEVLALSNELRLLVAAEDAAHDLHEQAKLIEARLLTITVYAMKGEYSDANRSLLSIEQMRRCYTLSADGQQSVTSFMELLKKSLPSSWLDSQLHTVLRLRRFDQRFRMATDWLQDEDALVSCLTASSASLSSRSACLVLECMTPADAALHPSIFDATLLPLRYVLAPETFEDSERRQLITRLDSEQNELSSFELVLLSRDSTLLVGFEALTLGVACRFIKYESDKCAMLSCTAMIGTLGLSAGDLLIVELTKAQTTPHIAASSTMTDDHSPFCSFFDRVKNEITLLFNLPLLSTESAPLPSFDETGTAARTEELSYSSISFNKQHTLRQLKESLAPLFALPSSAFTLARSSTSSAWRDLDVTLLSIGLSNQSSIFCRVEEQRSPSEVDLALFELRPPLYTFLPLGKLSLRRDLDLLQLQTLIAAHLETHLDSGSRQQWRVRDKKGVLSTKIIRMKPNARVDSLLAASVFTFELCIEFLLRPELPDEIAAHTLLVRFQLCCDATAASHVTAPFAAHLDKENAAMKVSLPAVGRTPVKFLGPVREMCLQKFCSVGQMKQRIQRQIMSSSLDAVSSLASSAPSVALASEAMMFARGLTTRKMTQGDLHAIHFVNVPDAKFCNGPPLCLRASDLLLVKVHPAPEKATQFLPLEEEKESLVVKTKIKPWINTRRCPTRAPTLMASVQPARHLQREQTLKIEVVDWEAEIAAIELACASATSSQTALEGKEQESTC